MRDATRHQVEAARDLLDRALTADGLAALGLLDLVACELEAARDGARMEALAWLRETDGRAPGAGPAEGAAG